MGIRIVFDGPPGPVAGRFIEVEDAEGNSIKVGDWREREDGNWELRIPPALPGSVERTCRVGHTYVTSEGEPGKCWCGELTAVGLAPEAK